MSELSSTDRVLAARIEAATAESMARLGQALNAVQPDTAAEPFAGGVAVFAGVGSPMTHAMGIGMQRAVPEAEMERMEAFFRDRNSPCVMDLCPLADPSVVAFVQSKRYRILEFNNVLARRITPDEEFETYPDVRPASPAEGERFARLMLTAFSDSVPFSEEMVQTMVATFGPMLAWFAGEPEPEAGAVMNIASGVALFDGDATVSAGRRKGWQAKLIRTRLLAAQRTGCDLAVCTVLPGSASHRNYERAGFRLIYMRVNLARDF